MNDTPRTNKFRASLDGMREINQRDRLLKFAKGLERETSELRRKLHSTCQMVLDEVGNDYMACKNELRSCADELSTLIQKHGGEG